MPRRKRSDPVSAAKRTAGHAEIRSEFVKVIYSADDVAELAKKARSLASHLRLAYRSKNNAELLSTNIVDLVATMHRKSNPSRLPWELPGEDRTDELARAELIKVIDERVDWDAIDFVEERGDWDVIGAELTGRPPEPDESIIAIATMLVCPLGCDGAINIIFDALGDVIVHCNWQKLCEEIPNERDPEKFRDGTANDFCESFERAGPLGERVIHQFEEAATILERADRENRDWEAHLLPDQLQRVGGKFQNQKIWRQPQADVTSESVAGEFAKIDENLAAAANGERERIDRSRVALLPKELIVLKILYEADGDPIAIAEIVNRSQKELAPRSESVSINPARAICEKFRKLTPPLAASDGRGQAITEQGRREWERRRRS